MIKRVGVFALAKGKDPEEAWRYWTGTHAINIKNTMPSLRKYVINRVIKGIEMEIGGISHHGPLLWWGISEQWFDNEEACVRAVNTPRQQDDVWSSFMGESFGDALVEEKIIIEEPIPKIHLKRIGFLVLREGKGSEEAWKYWADVHAVIWKNTSPGCRFYSIGRVIKAIQEPPQWWGLLEQTFDNEEAYIRLGNIPRQQDDFRSFVDFSSPIARIAYVEEKIIV